MSGFDAHRTKHAFMRVNRDRCMCAKARDLHQCFALHCTAIQHVGRSCKCGGSAAYLYGADDAEGGFSGGSIISDFRFEGFRSMMGFVRLHASEIRLHSSLLARHEGTAGTKQVFLPASVLQRGRQLEFDVPSVGLRFVRLRLVFVSMQRSANAASNCIAKFRV
jgi:hypothetical protein